jgi:hypothetical protein
MRRMIITLQAILRYHLVHALGVTAHEEMETWKPY